MIRTAFLLLLFGVVLELLGAPLPVGNKISAAAEPVQTSVNQNTDPPKMTDISANPASLHFGTVPIGTTAQRQIATRSGYHRTGIQSKNPAEGAVVISLQDGSGNRLTCSLNLENEAGLVGNVNETSFKGKALLAVNARNGSKVKVTVKVNSENPVKVIFKLSKESPDEATDIAQFQENNKLSVEIMSNQAANIVPTGTRIGSFWVRATPEEGETCSQDLVAFRIIGSYVIKDTQARFNTDGSSNTNNQYFSTLNRLSVVLEDHLRYFDELRTGEIENLCGQLLPRPDWCGDSNYDSVRYIAKNMAGRSLNKKDWKAIKKQIDQWITEILEYGRTGFMREVISDNLEQRFVYYDYASSATSYGQAGARVFSPPTNTPQAKVSDFLRALAETPLAGLRLASVQIGTPLVLSFPAIRATKNTQEDLDPVNGVGPFFVAAAVSAQIIVATEPENVWQGKIKARIDVKFPAEVIIRLAQQAPKQDTSLSEDLVKALLDKALDKLKEAAVKSMDLTGIAETVAKKIVEKVTGKAEGYLKDELFKKELQKGKTHAFFHLAVAIDGEGNDTTDGWHPDKLPVFEPGETVQEKDMLEERRTLKVSRPSAAGPIRINSDRSDPVIGFLVSMMVQVERAGVKSPTNVPQSYALAQVRVGVTHPSLGRPGLEPVTVHVDEITFERAE